MFRIYFAQILIVEYLIVSCYTINAQRNKQLWQKILCVIPFLKLWLDFFA